MASRFYFAASGSAAASPSIYTSWTGSVSGFARYPMDTATSNTALADHSESYPSTSDSQYAWAQFVSAQTLDVDQTISGSASIVALCNESAAGADLYLSLVLWVMKPDGTVRGLLKSQHDNTGGTEMGTARRTRIWSGLALSSVNALAGDRIVCEIGAFGLTPVSGATGQIRWGDPTSASDLALTSGLAGESDRPWVELSQTLTFGTPAGGTRDSQVLTFF